jgi:DNA modification methylase
MGKQQSMDQYAEDLTAIFMDVHRVLKDSGTIWLVIGDDPRGGTGTPRMVAARMKTAGWTVEREFTWENQDTGLEQQSVFLFTKAPLATPPRIEEATWNFSLDPSRDDYSWVTLPVPLVTRCVEASSNPGDLILDPFCGLASTGVAALILGRRFIGMDTDRRALQLAWERLRSVGGHASTPIDVLSS